MTQESVDDDIVDDVKQWIEDRYTWTPVNLFKLATNIFNYCLDRNVADRLKSRWWRSGARVIYRYWMPADESESKTELRNLVIAKRELRQRGLQVNDEIFKHRTYSGGIGGFVPEDSHSFGIIVYGSNSHEAQLRIKRGNRLILDKKKPEPCRHAFCGGLGPGPDQAYDYDY